ncbi:MAG: permease [Pirellulaceae bacterium]|nr:permease [Pirellulaceae bacterium]
MIELVFLSGFVRLVQALALAAPTILVSLFITGVIRRLFGPEVTRRVFGGAGWRSLVQSWAIGMLLPGCSLGVIPISRELRRAGLTGGAVLAFALSQPLFDPLSVLYGLTLSKPLVVFAFAGCSLVLVMAVGSIWDWLYPDSAAPEVAPPPVQAGWPRLVSILLVVLREAAGPSAAYIAIGLLGTATLGALLPHGALQRAMNGGDPWAPWTMTWVAIPAYATPTLAMSQLGSMFQHANSAGAALQLLTLGAGLNLGLVAWIFAAFGWRKGVAWFGLLVVAGLGMAYALDRPLHPTDVDPADHTHAFDIYCSPFHAGEPHLGLLAQQRIREILTPLNVVPLVVLGGLVLGGAVLRWTDPRERCEAWLESRERSRTASRYDFPLPAPVVGLVVLGGIVSLSVVGCYAYYPAKGEVFDEIRAVRADAIVAANQGDSRLTDHYIAVWDKWTRRLEVGVFLREWRLTPYQHMKARILREKLELLRHEVEDGDREAAKTMVRQVLVAQDRLRLAFE